MRRKLFRPKRFLKSLGMAAIGVTAFSVVVLGYVWGLVNLIMLLVPNPLVGLLIFLLVTLTLIMAVTLYNDSNIR